LKKAVVTLNRFIVEEERRHPEATGEFTSILYDIAFAAKVISRAVNKAGLIDIIGATGDENVHGEQVQKLDEYANQVIFNALDHGGHLCLMASEESEQPIPIPEQFPKGDYVLLYDPLDGSSNIDANVSIGTIFSVHRRRDPQTGDGALDDLLQPGVDQVAAGYVLYGSSTLLVYTSGAGVHGFTLDNSIGAFLLSHPRIQIPSPGKRIYSVNEAYSDRWDEGQKRLVERLKGEGGFSLRYIGSLVADFHRTLLYGGLFMYPADSNAPSGKLRLLYEISPLAMVCEQAGGAAIDGRQRILDIVPHELHQRVPAYMGSTEYVDLAAECLSG
jgi:fructose-1,6-bisphosphatase I